MSSRIILILLVAFGLYLFGRWFVRTPPEKVVKMVRSTLLVVAGLLLILLVATGRLHWLFALIGSMLPFAQRLFGVWRLVQQLRFRTQKPASGQTSTIRTGFLEMQLDHDSGTLSGRVIAGQFAGQDLAGMSLDDLLSLRQECQTNDPQSATVLETYLDRTQGEAWRQQAGNSGAQHTPPQDWHGTMSQAEALQILGLKSGATPSEIKQTHKRLMQKLHPDQGGSNFLASMINQAKELLLKG